VLQFLEAEFPKMFEKIRFGTPEKVKDWHENMLGLTTDLDMFGPPVKVGIGLKPVSMQGSDRLIAAALDYAIATGRKSVTFVSRCSRC
jgi:isocitrate dehydrogenase